MEKNVAALVSVLVAVLSREASEDSGPDGPRAINGQLEGLTSDRLGGAGISQTEWTRTCAAVRQMLGAR